MPDTSTVHHDVALTNVSIAYENSAYIAARIAPEVSVRRQSDRYFIYDPEREAFRESFDGRAPGAEAREIDFQLSYDSYYCDDHALESAVPDEERENADSPLAPQVDRVEFLTDKILLNMEIGMAAKLRDPAVVPSADLSAGNNWSDESSGDPAADIETARAAILDTVQQLPNTLVLPYSVYTTVRNHPKVAERVKYTSSGAVGPQALAQLFDVERVLVARSVRNTASAGQPPSMEPIWGKDALLLYTPRRASLKSISAALTFSWARAAGSSRGVAVQTWREERRKATMVRVQKYYDQKIVAPGAAYLLQNAVD